MMHKSKIENIKTEPQPNDAVKADGLPSAQVEQNPMLCAGLSEFQKIAQMVMSIDHIGVQCDNIHKCEEKHHVILTLDKLEKHDAIRLLIHVIHVQQLQLAGAKIEYDIDNPFKDMVNFKFIDDYVKCNSPEMETLY